MVNISLVGCGVIGSRLAIEIQQQFSKKTRLVGIYDADEKAARRLQKRLRPSVPVLPPSSLISRTDLLIEAASAKAVGELLPQVIRKRKAMMILSSGGLLAHPSLMSKALKAGVPLYLPSGAIAGLDGIKAGRIGKLRSVTLTTRKPPRTLMGAPGAEKRRLNLKSLRKPVILFEGTARQAVAAFPQNINVAATLSLAGIGPFRTRVRIIADPAVRTNTHEVVAIGTFGKLVVRTENKPFPENPKTSLLAVLSAIAALQQILEPFRIGT